ncbi:4Fe-4S binding protein [Sporolituus thermophilus]|uniref:2-oxoacid:acceptor oxidoreductase, delta subunit, pyruvate/2-ketoisovalerate family n=1 Tax=Sporolituus thermophilus DSM 23256 TaxID=1123285 RepID=A0A1G7IR24_9FIRM|nr:4Fe-4S binding protein [Sporolituus thermophilus]SDF15018.1 2-oxoacid:acceptor oxidoreductase, delta subunit, pyruvate/2-ketoisovalerate family [Sporolituus thermophilus DSM 23256]
MKLVSLKPVVDKDKCIGCGICSKVCPAETIAVKERKAEIDLDHCRGCGACNQRCPVYAITMEKLEKPYTVKVDIADLAYDEIANLCIKAKLNPDQIICYCTATRAEEVAGAILKGAKTPEEISRRTGIRMGCKVECIQPVLRLLKAAGITPERPAGYQWYGLTPTVWDIPEEVKAKYNSRGFYFDEDIKLLDKVVEAKPSGRDSE